MNKIFDPIVSEFDGADHEAQYNAWFKAKVEKSLADSNAPIPHDEAIALIQHELEKRAKQRAHR